MSNPEPDSIEESPDEVAVKAEMSGTEHIWRFNKTGNRSIYPTYFEQGGEKYRLHKEDVPDFVSETLKTDLGVKIEER